VAGQGERDNTVRQDSHCCGNHGVKLRGFHTVGVGGQSMAITGGLPRFSSMSSTCSRVLPF
jgi:hypothetical protein